MTEEISTHNLLVQLKHGNEHAFDLIYKRHARQFFHYALSQKLTPEEAEDAVEETFDRLLICISNYSEVICGGEHWLWSMCRHKVTDTLRRRKKQALQLLESYPSSEEANPEIYFEKQEDLQTLKRAWEKISEADRQAIRQGRGRGPGRKAYHEAMQRMSAAFSEEENRR
jgi:RNA polymerase sigma factor (sigma-70 family)